MATLTELIAKSKNAGAAAVSLPQQERVVTPEPARTSPNPPAALAVQLPTAIGAGGLGSTLADINHHSMPDSIPVPQVDALREQIENLRNSFEYPEQVMGATRNILLFLHENPQFTKLLEPEDYGIMVKALRQCHGVAQTNKVQAITKRSAKQQESAATQSMLANMLSDLGL